MSNRKSVSFSEDLTSYSDELTPSPEVAPNPPPKPPPKRRPPIVLAESSSDEEEDVNFVPLTKSPPEGLSSSSDEEEEFIEEEEELEEELPARYGGRAGSPPRREVKVKREVEDEEKEELLARYGGRAGSPPRREVKVKREVEEEEKFPAPRRASSSARVVERKLKVEREVVPRKPLVKEKVVEEELVEEEEIEEHLTVPAVKTKVIDRKVVPGRKVMIEEDVIVTTTQTRTPAPKKRITLIPAEPAEEEVKVEAKKKVEVKRRSDGRVELEEKEELETKQRPRKVVVERKTKKVASCGIGSPPIPAPILEDEEVEVVATTRIRPQLVKAVVQSKPVEQILRRYGYTCLSKLTVESAEGDLQGKYLKCLDPLGNLVYVKPDLKDTYVTVEVTDHRVTLTDEIREIPYSSRKTYLDLATSECTGVAIEASCGVCFLTAGVSRPHAEHFMYGTAPIASKCGVPINAVLDAVPIVSLCEIGANPTQVLQNTEVVTARILNKTFAVCCSDLKVYTDALNGLVGSSRGFQEKETQIMNQLRCTTEWWRKEAKKALSSIGTCEAKDARVYREKHAAIMYNLERRNVLRVELARICRTIGVLSVQLEEARRTICELDKYLDAEFCGISGQFRR